MNKKIISILLVLVMLAMNVCAIAEETAPVPSITLGEVAAPEGVTYEETFVVYVTPVAEETKEAVVLEKIASFVTETEAPVVTYFPEETVTAVAEYLPEEFDAETLVMDEFFPLKEEGYTAEYGDVEAVFEFLTVYEDETVLVALVGILPTDDEIAAAEAALEEGEELDEQALIAWYPQNAVVEEGKVRITFTEDVLTLLADHDAVMALLRGDEIPEVETEAE